MRNGDGSTGRRFSHVITHLQRDSVGAAPCGGFELGSGDTHTAVHT